MKAAEIEVKALFDLSHSMAGEFLAKFRYPYEALPELGAWIAAVGPQLSSDEYEKRGEQIWIHKSAKVAPSVSLTGPLIVCANAELRHCAYFRGNVLIGAGSVAGNSCEFKNSLLFDSVEAPHYNYVGDSILGDYVEIGCGTVLNPGAVVGKNTMIYPLTSVRGPVPANSIVKSAENIVIKQD